MLRVQAASENSTGYLISQEPYHKPDLEYVSPDQLVWKEGFHTIMQCDVRTRPPTVVSPTQKRVREVECFPPNEKVFAGSGGQGQPSPVTSLGLILIRYVPT